MLPQRLTGSHIPKESILTKLMTNQVITTGVHMGNPSLLTFYMPTNLQKHLKEDGVNITANFLHPGTIVTNLFHHNSAVNGLINVIGKLVLKNVQQGAATTCYVALHPQVKEAKNRALMQLDSRTLMQSDKTLMQSNKTLVRLDLELVQKWN
ncbi:hypothetical protein KIW84_012927 [Lathyrus oleraceus]|uniref:Short-chain dehydrogenase TIC 32, chloroplastic n=1 Tax=Pisum sativum TaxID=3888 RepID=A0A9D5BIT3_PEA|nr:hypothetical protein KIW84_012927 [Pisum sativum]